MLARSLDNLLYLHLLRILSIIIIFLKKVGRLELAPASLNFAQFLLLLVSKHLQSTEYRIEVTTDGNDNPSI